MDTVAFLRAAGGRYSARLRPVAIQLVELCACDPVMVALRIRVLERRTGIPVSLPSIVAVNLNTGEDWTNGRQPPYSASGWATLSLRAGTYHMVVSAPGYRPWIHARIKVDSAGGTREVHLRRIGRD